MKRIYQKLISQHLSTLRQMVFLMGPRQVGKTTVSREAAAEWPGHFYFSWDNSADRLLFIEGPNALAKQVGLEELASAQPVLIFEAIHKFGKWKNVGWWQLSINDYGDNPAPPVKFSELDKQVIKEIIEKYNSK